MALCLLFSAFLPAPASAADTKNRGLLITPIRSYLTVDPEKVTMAEVTVANLTKNSIDVTLSPEEFSVVDYTYDYKFKTPPKKWIKIQTPQVTLAPGTSQKVKYQVLAPKTAEPGGHYFTIVASSTLKPNEEVRAASTLYLTVSGELVKTSAIVSSNVPFISFGGQIPFRFDVKNTGNAHFFAVASGRLEGLSAQPEKNEAAHILLPRTVRTIDGSFSPPLLPGVYKAIYGYKTDEGAAVTQAKYVLYTPLWSYAVFGGIIWFLVVFLKRHHRLRHR